MKIKKKKPKITAKCSYDDCNRRAKAKHECITCEYLLDAGKVESVHTVYACGHHQAEGLAAMKRHALTAHPINIVRAAVAALKGEDVF